MNNPVGNKKPELTELVSQIEDLAVLMKEPQECISSSLKLLVEVMRAERGFVLLVSDGEPYLRPYAGYNVDLENILINEEVSQTIMRTVVEKQAPLLTTNAMQDPRFADKISVLIAGLRSVICIPFASERGFFGLLYLDNRTETGFFKAQDRDYLAECSKKLMEIIETRCDSLIYKPGVQNPEPDDAAPEISPQDVSLPEDVKPGGTVEPLPG
jgi:adenylate cyclase